MPQMNLDQVSRLALEANPITANFYTLIRALEARREIVRLRANSERMDAGAREYLGQLPI